MRRFASVASVLALAGTLLLAGCAGKSEPKVTPKVKPPAIATAGVLKAGVDLSTPPFAGEKNGSKAGLDVDVAAALGDRLGLTVEYIDVSPSDAATALAEGRADVVLSIPLTTADLSRITPAGTYLSDAPGVFMAQEGSGSVEPSLTLESLPLDPVAVQKESESYWLLRQELGDAAIKEFDSLREAFEAVSAGEIKLAAGDALVGGYLMRDFPKVQLAGQLADASPLAVAVLPDNDDLSEAVRSALDGLAADGVLESIRRKWVDGLPQLMSSETTESSQ